MHAQTDIDRDRDERVTWIERETPANETNDSGALVRLRAGLTASLRRRWWFWAIAAVVLVAALVWFRMSGPTPPVAAEADSRQPLISITTPGRSAVASTVSFTGTIRARHEMPVGAEGEGGRIASLRAEIGDRVRQGQVLATLDTAVIAPQVASLAAALEEARATAELREAEYRRARGVEASGALSAEEIERRRSAAVTGDAQVKVAEAQLAEARARLARTLIRAPGDGLVLTRAAEVGQTATAGGEPLFTLARNGEIEMIGQVAEQDLPRLEVGQPAQVKLTGIDAPFAGRVRLIGAVIDPQTRLGEVRIALAPHRNLRPGAFARGAVSVASAERPLLPQTAVLADNKGTYVYIVNGDDRVERRNVRVAGTESRGIVIAAGLEGSERVVSTAGAFLREGEKVRIAGPVAGASAGRSAS